MAILKVKFEEEHIKLIRWLNFEHLEIADILKRQGVYSDDAKDFLFRNKNQIDGLCGIDTYNLWGGTFIWEEMANILGYGDQVIPGTSESVYGPRYPKEIMDRMFELSGFIIDHLLDIEQILHQFCTEGIQAGVTYTCMDNQRIWKKEIDK